MEVMENPLAVIVNESGLEPSKAKYILDNFQNYFEIAAEWEKKAQTLIVTKPDQKAEMEMARTGRLFLREKRIAIENSRKKLKEEALREGKAIDGIANVLKALIVPIEEYLDRQEHFVEIQQEKKEAAMRLEIEQRMEAERIAKEKADAEALEKARLENERLKKEAAEKDRKAAEERAKQEKALAAERAKAQEAKDKAEAEARAVKAKADAEKAAIEAKARLEREKAEADKRKAAEAAQKKLDSERKEKERLEALLKSQIECPKCHHKFNKEK